MPENGTGQGRNERRRRGTWLLLLLMVALFAVLFYQSVNYIGLIHRLAEWQFEYFDRYWPVLTIILILLLLYAVWEAVRFLLARIRGQSSDVPKAIRQISARRSASRFLDVVTIVGVALMAGTAIQWLQQPSSSGSPQRIALSSERAIPVRAGPVTVTGAKAIGPIARYSEDFLLIRKTRFLAPVGRSPGPGAPFNLFVEVRGMDPARDVPERISGVLRTNALMPEVRTLYADAGLPVARNSVVVFATVGSANRPYLVLLLNQLVISLICWLFAKHLWRTAERMENRLEPSLPTGRAATA